MHQISIAGYDLEGYQWFFSMIVVAFWLQIISNFIWLKNSQLSREILRGPPGSDTRQKLVRWSSFWVGISTIVWILRIVLVIGNNIWIFIVILLGNVTGNHWALTVQEADLSRELIVRQEKKKGLVL
jgi:hypothetical protein